MRTPRQSEGWVGLAVLSGLVALTAGLVAWQALRPTPLHGFGLSIDRLSSSLALLVAAIGAITFRFSIRYLDGQPRRDRFLWMLAGTIASAYLLMLADHLLFLLAAWFGASVGLHGLLTFYHHRPEALRPARKKFLISRLGDLALIAAIVVIAQHWGTLSLHTFIERATEAPATPALNVAAMLIAIAALTKSAQFPFHSWLPETMEAPTPVSALMHAGVINAGGALLLRFAPIIVRAPDVLLLLSVVGTLTFTLGMVAMWAQAKVKRTLAWSTVSQMGFMMVQIGLGAFPAAALHIVGHGCYKAWSFLWSGEVISPVTSPSSPRRALSFAVLGTTAAVPALALAAWVTGFPLLHSPGEIALLGVVALSLGQFWAATFADTQSVRPWRILATLLVTVGAATLALGLYQATERFLAPSLGELPTATGMLAWAAACVPIVALVGLIILHANLPVLGRSSAGRAFFVHALHGFYLGVVADRLVEAAWPRPTNSINEVRHA